MTQAIQKLVAIDGKVSPQERMLALGKQNQEIMTARIKALGDGLTVMHHELCKLTEQNENAQRELLSAHPELMLMVTNSASA